LKEFQKALNDCNRAITINPEFAKAYKRMSKAYIGLGRLDVS